MRVELVGSPPSAVKLRPSLLERVAALVPCAVTLPLSQLARVRVVALPWRDRPWRGLRVGTGLPVALLLGRTVSWSRSTDLVFVRGRGQALVLDLAPRARWRCVVVSAHDAEQLAERLQGALGARDND